jgi:hypothetical protein
MSTKNPPNASDVASVVSARLGALKSLNDAKESLTVEWRGTQIHIPVVSMPVELLTYNPETHRIRAQRSCDLNRENDLVKDPWGSSAQNYLHNLLMGDPSDPMKVDPSFIALKEDLRVHGQNDPGIINQAGVLINGNTRRAALKELGVANIRVGVLPTDASHEDLQAIELSLQLRKDHRRDYSFMNFLLAIDERIASGQLPASVQKDFRISASIYDRSMWILGFVREAITRSAISLNNGMSTAMSLVEFETHKGKLEELYRAYKVLAPKSPLEARALREQRLLALILNKSKTDLRLIEPDFVKKYMKECLPEVSQPPSVVIPGTKIIVPGPDIELTALQQLTTNALQARSISGAVGKASPDEISAASSALGRLDEYLVKGLNFAGRQARIVKRRLAAVDRISDACEDIDYAVDAVASARATANFDPDDIDEVLLTLRSSLEKLSMVITRGSEPTLEGITWLTAAVSHLKLED